jgi:predicted HTH domain antitoxin
MTAATSYPLRIPKNLMELANLKIKEEHVDKSTALRQFMYKGARDYVLELYNSGRISLSKAAQLLDTSTFEIVRIACEQKLIPGATESQQKKSRGTSREFSV